MVYCAGRLIENLKLFYKSNRPHFLWVYRHDNPLGMLEEHSKSLSIKRFCLMIYKLSRVLPTTCVGYHAGKPIESVVYCLNIHLGKQISPGTDQSMEHVLFSSGIDGIVARQLNQTSAFGAWV